MFYSRYTNQGTNLMTTKGSISPGSGAMLNVNSELSQSTQTGNSLIHSQMILSFESFSTSRADISSLIAVSKFVLCKGTR